MSRKLATFVRNLAGRACARLAATLEEASRRLTVCPSCGRSLFYGKPCHGQKKEATP